MERFDLIIAGAGPAGAAFACAVAPWFKRVALVDAHPQQGQGTSDADPRTLALANTSARILAGLGVWRHVSEAATPIRKVRLMTSGGDTETLLDGSHQHFGALGFTVAAEDLTAILHRRLNEPTIHWFAPHRIEAVCIGDDAAVATLDDRTRLAGRLLVAADGTRSLIRDALGVVTRDHDYHQQAILAELVASEPAHQTAFEVLTQSGLLALLPHGDRWSLVWVQREGDTEALLALDDPAFIARLEAQLGNRLTFTKVVGRRWCYPLHQVAAWTLTGERTALLGNAAHTVHPVGAQGLNLGLRDVATLAELLVQAVRAGLDPGDPGVLREYARRRAPDHRRVLAFTDTLARPLGEERHPLRPWLSTGLGLLNALPPLRRGLVRLGIGGFDTATRLSRGLPL